MCHYKPYLSQNDIFPGRLPAPYPVPMRSTRVARPIAAGAPVVYRALLDPLAVAVGQVPDRQVVEFGTPGPDLLGAMRVTTASTPAAGGVDVVIEHRGIPAGVDPHDDEVGTRMSPDRLAAWVERTR